MKKISLKQVYYSGITVQIPEIWSAETEEYTESDGSKSYSISVSAAGNDVRGFDISTGVIPADSDAYTEACRTYEDVISEEEINEDDEPIICFEFQKHEAYGFSVRTEEGIPCFFFCVDMQSKAGTNLLTVLVSAPDDTELKNMIDFVEEYLSVE